MVSLLAALIYCAILFLAGALITLSARHHPTARITPATEFGDGVHAINALTPGIYRANVPATSDGCLIYLWVTPAVGEPDIIHDWNPGETIAVVVTTKYDRIQSQGCGEWHWEVDNG